MLVQHFEDFFLLVVRGIVSSFFFATNISPRLILVLDMFEPKSGQISLRCQGTSSTRTDCGLMIPVACPIPKVVVHLLCGSFTISYFVLYVTFLGLWRHHIYPFETNFVHVNSIGRCSK